MTAVVICDPPSALRDALAARVAAVPEVSRVDMVDDVHDLAAAVQDGPGPDLVLLSTQLSEVRVPAAVRMIRRLAPGTRVLLLTMGTDPDDVVAGMAAGAVGYLARDAILAEAAAALALLGSRNGAGSGRAPRTLDAGPDLTDREWQVLLAISRGCSNSEIGQQLFLSQDTIKTHARRLFRKLGVKDRAHAVAEGFRRGLLP